MFFFLIFYFVFHFFSVLHGVKRSAEFVCAVPRISIEVYNFEGGQCTFYLIAMWLDIGVQFQTKSMLFWSVFFLFVVFALSLPNFSVSNNNQRRKLVFFATISWDRKQSIIIWINSFLANHSHRIGLKIIYYNNIKCTTFTWIESNARAAEKEKNAFKVCISVNIYYELCYVPRFMPSLIQCNACNVHKTRNHRFSIHFFSIDFQ